MKTIHIKDESAIGDVLNKITLEFEQEYITVEELIFARIKAEIQTYTSNTKSYRNGLVRPTNIEQRLNYKESPNIDPEKQLYIALDAFNKNGFILIVDEEQVEDINQKVWVDESTDVSFIKLTPLVGG